VRLRIVVHDDARVDGGETAAYIGEDSLDAADRFVGYL
jgi:hypothetical protein